MNNKKEKFLTCQDHTVTNEKFDLILDDKLEMLVTYPKPSDEGLDKYYKSEAYISHTDANTSFFDKVYQAVKNYTIKRKIKLINSLNTESRTILDIGCGTGDFLESCIKNGWNINGVEPNEGARNLAIKKTEISIYADIEEILKLNDVKFDVITMWHVLEHIPNLKDYILILNKILKPKGTLIIAVPNYKCYDATYYGKFWAAYDVPRHLWHFSQKSIKVLFSKVDLQVVKILPMKFDAYYVSLLSEKNRSGYSNPIQAMYRGFLSNFRASKNKEYSSLIYLIKRQN